MHSLPSDASNKTKNKKQKPPNLGLLGGFALGLGKLGLGLGSGGGGGGGLLGLALLLLRGRGRELKLLRLGHPLLHRRLVLGLPNPPKG